MAWVEVHGGQRSLAFGLTTVPHNHRTVTTRLVLVQEGAFTEHTCNVRREFQPYVE